MIKKLLGVVMLLIGLVGLVLSIGVAVVVNQTMDSIGVGLDDSLTLTIDSLDTVKDTLELTQTTIVQVNDALETVEDTSGSISQTIADTEPLLGAVSDVTSETLPDSIQAFQDTVPNMASVAGAIDDSLLTLSDFEIDEEVFGVGLQFDLGIEYEPTEPFDETVAELGNSLDGVPEQLRGLKVHIDTTTDNLLTISENISDIGENLATINGSIAEVDPLLDEYIGLIDQVKDSTETVKSDLERQVQNVKTGLMVIFIWMALLNVPPLYIGAELLSGEREQNDDDNEDDENEDGAGDGADEESDGDNDTSDDAPEEA